MIRGLPPRESVTATPAAMRRPGKAGASLRERARRVLGVVSEHSKDIISMAQTFVSLQHEPSRLNKITWTPPRSGPSVSTS